MSAAETFAMTRMRYYEVYNLRHQYRIGPAGIISLQEVQKFTYNSGSAIGCRHANDNLPNEKQLDLDCLYKEGDDMSYEAYIELRNEVDRK